MDPVRKGDEVLITTIVREKTASNYGEEKHYFGKVSRNAHGLIVLYVYSDKGYFGILHSEIKQVETIIYSTDPKEEE